MNEIGYLIKDNEKLIYKIINRYRNYFELDDLYQVATIGIIKAYNNYKNDLNTKFITYAYPYIIGEVIKYVNSNSYIKHSNEVNSLYFKIQKASEILSQKLMKIPSVKDLSLFLELDEKVIDNILKCYEKILSLDKIIFDDEKNIELYNMIGYKEQNIENIELRSAIESLSIREQDIIKSRYYENMTQQEIAKKNNMYQVEVSREEKKILKKIKDSITC